MEGGMEGKSMKDKQKQTQTSRGTEAVWAPREASYPMEKIAAGVYTNSPTGAVASTVSNMEKQKGEIGGGLGDRGGCSGLNGVSS